MAQTQSGSLRLFRLFGINVFLHWSWALVAYFQIQNPVNHYHNPLFNALEYLSLFAIVLMHEFGHALACRSVGGSANRILLWPFGGVAFVNPPPRPGALLWSIVAGPLVNVILIPVTLGLVVLASNAPPSPTTGDIYRFTLAVAYINGILLVFNILPIYPLDGGQILRSLLWFIIGPAKSLMTAAVIGLLGAAAVAFFALKLGDWWLIALAILGGMQSYAGFQQARAMFKILALPRRPEARCPNCGQNPPIGPLWSCSCGQLFDTFAHHATCPRCQQSFNTAACPDCRTPSPLHSWLPLPINPNPE